MRTTLPITLSAACLMTGCSHSGDASAFIITEVTKYGGHTRTNFPLSKLNGRWTVHRDENGFQARVTGVSFSAMDAQLRQVLGTPNMSGRNASTQMLYSNWAARDTGVAIIMIEYRDHLDITCVSGLPDMGNLLQKVGEA